MESEQENESSETVTVPMEQFHPAFYLVMGIGIGFFGGFILALLLSRIGGLV